MKLYSEGKIEGDTYFNNMMNITGKNRNKIK